MVVMPPALRRAYLPGPGSRTRGGPARWLRSGPGRLPARRPAGSWPGSPRAAATDREASARSPPASRAPGSAPRSAGRGLAAGSWCGPPLMEPRPVAGQDQTQETDQRLAVLRRYLSEGEEEALLFGFERGRSSGAEDQLVQIDAERSVPGDQLLEPRPDRAALDPQQPGR